MLSYNPFRIIPSNLQMNPVVKAFIISEAFFWGAWNFITPIAAIFVLKDIKGGNVELAAFGYSSYLMSRVFFELLCGKFLIKTTDRKKFSSALIGMTIVSAGYIGFAASQSILELFAFYIVLGMGLGISTPAKNALFSIHLDKNKETTEWSIADAVNFVADAIAISIGGIIAGKFGFQALFLMAALVNGFSLIPYLLYVKKVYGEI